MTKENHHYSEDRDDRVKETAEVFTPDWLVQNMLDSLKIDWTCTPQDKLFIDPTCGSGNFLVALAYRNVPICNIYGVDLMHDNIKTAKRRLTEIYLEKSIALKDIEYHLNRNIICADALTYHYEFWWHDKEKEEKFGSANRKYLEEKRKRDSKILEAVQYEDDEW